MQNQLNRHEAAQEVAKLKNCEHMQLFKEIINERGPPSFDQQLQHAIDYPESDQAKELDKKLSPFITFPGKKIGWSAQEPRILRYNIYSLNVCIEGCDSV